MVDVWVVDGSRGDAVGPSTRRRGLFLPSPALLLASGVYRIPQMRDSLTGHHARIAQCHGRVCEAVEQSDTLTEQDCGEIDVKLVEESGVQTLLDRVSAMDADRLVASGALACATAVSTPSVTKCTLESSGHPSGT
jgi:hypothetical protein